MIILLQYIGNQCILQIEFLLMRPPSLSELTPKLNKIGINSLKLEGLQVLDNRKLK